ncbi:MAG: DEAD/DEAH box helicase [Eubacteriales bacterium]|nr:DEAD/DEAH box helicase [Eubacteriales bacterium]
MNTELHTCLGTLRLSETVRYPNGGYSCFYTDEQIAVIIDYAICAAGAEKRLFEYSMLTGKQNDYMKKFQRVYRFLAEDMAEIDDVLMQKEGIAEYSSNQNDRADLADASPLEMKFENLFMDVYGADGSKYLWKEYGVTDLNGRTKYLDYYLKTDDGEYAIEENGVSYHHPQLIGLQRYREQLAKQNTCVNQNIKLFRFSSEDCRFEDRMEDDIRSFFGQDSRKFHDRGLLVDRPVALYEHQKLTLDKIEEQRKAGVRSFLVVQPTASGKSRIMEEDIKVFAAARTRIKVLILVPNTNVKEDWLQRVQTSLLSLQKDIRIVTYAYMERHYREYSREYFNYMVVDEAHHAVAPGLKRVIQYFSPEFLVGITATDERPDRRKLETVFGSYHVGMSLQEAMDKNIIARANVYRIETNIDLSKVRINEKEYVNADLEKSIRVTSRNELIVDVIREYFCDGAVGERQGIIFCVSVKHTLEVEKLLRAAGIPGRSYTSQSKDPEQIMEDFKAHQIRFLCTCQMISEGWDYPELGILIMARPTLSKVLYLQQLGRGLRKTNTKQNVFVVDVVDEYGSIVKPCTMHSIFSNPYYVPFGDIAERDYHVGDFITVDGLHERIERIVEVDMESFEQKYGDYLSVEQLAREYFVSTGTITSWIKSGRIVPTAAFTFGSRKIFLFSKEDAEKYRVQLQIPVHNDETIYRDFFAFLEERDYSLSYKMPFLTYFIKHMNASGDAEIDAVLDDYIRFYENRIEQGLVVDRKSCPFTAEVLKDRSYVKRNMLTNPFEKFERKRFLYYSKDLGILSMNHALHAQLTKGDYEKILEQMHLDLENYYAKL